MGLWTGWKQVWWIQNSSENISLEILCKSINILYQVREPGKNGHLDCATNTSGLGFAT